MLARARVDARDPQRARLALLVLATGVRVLQRLFRLLARDLDAVLGAPTEASGDLPHAPPVQAHGGGGGGCCCSRLLPPRQQQQQRQLRPLRLPAAAGYANAAPVLPLHNAHGATGAGDPARVQASWAWCGRRQSCCECVLATTRSNLQQQRLSTSRSGGWRGQGVAVQWPTGLLLLLPVFDTAAALLPTLPAAVQSGITAAGRMAVHRGRLSAG